MGVMNDGPLYSSRQIKIPLNLPYILNQFAKAAIRTQPNDLLYWSAVYFRALADGTVPPVKDRYETLPTDAPVSFTAGFLRVLIKQLGKRGIHPEIKVIEKWLDLGLDEDMLQSILKLGGYTEMVRWLNFIAIAAGYLCPNLTETMVLLCEVLTDEPDGGAATVLCHTLVPLYQFLARMNCGPDCHLDEDFEDFFVQPIAEPVLEVPELVVEEEEEETLSQVGSDYGLTEVASMKSGMKLPSSALDWSEEEEDLQSIFDLKEEPSVSQHEVAVDVAKSDSSDSGDNAGITLTFHDKELDIIIEDFTGPVVLKPKKKELKRREEKKLERERRRQQRQEEFEKKRQVSAMSTDESLEEEIVERKKKKKEEKEKEKETVELEQDPLLKAIFDDESVDAEVVEEESSEESEYEMSIILSEEEQSEEDDREAEEERLRLEREAREEERRIVQRELSSWVDGLIDEGLRQKASRLVVADDGLVLDKASLLEVRMSAETPKTKRLTLADVRALRVTTSISSEPDHLFWAHVPGIGPTVPEEQIAAVVAYLRRCAEKQGGWVMPRNLRHVVCPPLGAQPQEAQELAEPEAVPA